MTESFESAMTLARMIMAEGDMPLLDRLQDAHEHELEHVRKSRFHEGYVAGQRSMDAEHYAVALRLRALPLDGDTTENLVQIARAVWHSDFGWTHGACRALRDELVRLLGGVSERPYPTSTYDALGNERHKAVYRLREYEPRMGGKPTEEASRLIRCVTGNDDSHVACANDLEETRDRLIHLLGGDEPTAMEYIQRIVREHDRKCLDMELSGAELSQSSVEAMSRRSESDESGEVTITAELRERIAGVCKVSGLSGEKLYGIADRIDEQEHKLRKQRDGFKRAMCAAQDLLEKRTDECDELQAKLEEAEFAIANWREREKSFDASERLREELRRERDELRERLDRVADALRGVERGTISAWEAADEVGRSSPHG